MISNIYHQAETKYLFLFFFLFTSSTAVAHQDIKGSHTTSRTHHIKGPCQQQILIRVWKEHFCLSKIKTQVV